MTALFEIHKYRGFRITVTGSMTMFTIFFITFGVMAHSLQEILNSHVADAIGNYLPNLMSELSHDISTYGSPALAEEVAEALAKATAEKSKTA